MKTSDFQALLTAVAKELTGKMQAGASTIRSSTEFEQQCRLSIEAYLKRNRIGHSVDFAPHPYAFPDIVLGTHGVELKFSSSDSWRTVANSIFERHRVESVRDIYVMLCKAGGRPEVRWARYGDAVVHVRTSHVPRFEIEIGAPQSLFAAQGLSYEEFTAKSEAERMEIVRNYARKRLRPGERLWWLEGAPDGINLLPAQATMFRSLDKDMKRRLRAEAAILCPSVVGSSRARDKYDDAVLYIMTRYGVLCPQARDLFSAGSVAGKARGGNYILRALRDIEDEMRQAAQDLPAPIIREYWGKDVRPAKRIQYWLSLADGHASGWTPSACLFK